MSLSTKSLVPRRAIDVAAAGLVAFAVGCGGVVNVASAAPPAAPPAANAPAVAIALPPNSPLPAGSATAPNDWRASVREFAQQHFRNPAWGASHSARVYALAVALAREDGVVFDDDVLYAAAFLHDTAAFPPWAMKDVDHADVGAGIVGDLLAATGFPTAKVEAVRGAIRTHMFFRTPATGPEALYLHDADALDWLGAIGVARVVALVDPNGGAPDVPAIVQRLEMNLASVPAGVLSPAGRKHLPERRAQLEAFLRTLREQTDDLRTL